MSLTSPRFAGNPRLEKAAQNNPAMGWRETGEPVRIIQQAFIDLGFSMPISVKKTGSPDGIFGAETFNTTKAFQTKYGLTSDGIVGKQTMAKLDSLLRTPRPIPPAPPLIPYLVPGPVPLIKQPSGMACWATSYTMLENWKNGHSTTIHDALVPLGQKWVDYFDKNTGTSPYDNIEFARAAGLSYEPLMSRTIAGWAQLLRQHGLLWLSFGWQVAGLNGLPVKGRHIILISGIKGDGTPSGTTIVYIDPGDGAYHEYPFATFVADYERGFTIDPNMSDQQMSGFSQILHY